MRAARKAATVGAGPKPATPLPYNTQPNTQTPLTKSLRTGLLYNTWIGRLLLRLPLTWWLLSWEHKRIAAYANSPTSKKRIPSMIKVRVLGWCVARVRSRAAEGRASLHRHTPAADCIDTQLIAYATG